jgi:hypothetical protein
MSEKLPFLVTFIHVRHDQTLPSIQIWKTFSRFKLPPLCQPLTCLFSTHPRFDALADPKVDNFENLVFREMINQRPWKK